MKRQRIFVISAALVALTAVLVAGIAIYFSLNRGEEHGLMNNNTTQTNLGADNTTSSAAQKAVFNFDTQTVTLNSGYEMPLNGIGAYSLTGDTCYNAISSALASGVRLIDTAYMYGNEAEVGRAIRDSGVPREEIFVITKNFSATGNTAQVD